MSTQAVEVRLAVRPEPASVVASLMFINRSDASFLLDQLTACADGEIEKNVFVVTTDAARLSYVGIRAKREEPGPDDYIRLEPGQSFQVEVHLEQAYEFLGGTHQYVARYEALNPTLGEDDFTELTSNAVTFTWTH